MYAVDTESRQEVWMDPLGLARGTLPEYRTATHTVAAEWAYARGYTLRTPPEKPMSDITAGTWRRFIEAGVAQVVAPLKPANDEHTLHTGHVYVGPPILE